MKLIDIPVIFICPSHNERYIAREKHTYELLQTIGFKSITHFKSGTEAYPTCLVKATIDILNTYMDDEPILILEDDVEMYKELNSETNIDLPEDYDAFYLGFSKSGGSKTKNTHCGRAKITKISDTYIRILNMLSGHAIIYKSKKYKERVCECLKIIQEIKGHFKDVAISRIQSEYKIYAYYYPLFYQSVKWGNPPHAENSSRFQF